MKNFLFLLIVLAGLAMVNPFSVHAYQKTNAVSCDYFSTELQECQGETSYFEEGETPYFSTAVKNIKVDHKWRYVVYKDGKKFFSYSDAEMKEVENFWEVGYIYGYISFGPGEGAKKGIYEVYFYLDTGNGFKFYDFVRFYVGSNKSFYIIPHNNPKGSLKVTNLIEETTQVKLYAITGSGNISRICFQLGPKEKVAGNLEGSYDAIAVIGEGENIAVAFMPDWRDEYRYISENSGAIKTLHRGYFSSDRYKLELQNWGADATLVSVMDADGNILSEFKLPKQSTKELNLNNLNFDKGVIRVLSREGIFLSITNVFD